MKAPHLISWFSIPTIIIACGPEGPDDVTQDGEASAAGGAGTIVATSDSALADTTSTETAAASATSGAEPFAGATSDGSTVVPGAGATTAGNDTAGSAAGGASASDGATTGRIAVTVGGAVHNVTGGASTTASAVSGSGGAGGALVDAAGGAAGQASSTTGEEIAPVIPGSLMITEYLESGSDKAIEISNLGSAPLVVDACELNIYFNGASEPGRRIVLQGELPVSASHVVCKTSAPDLLAVCDQQAGGLTFNGDDVVTLVCDAAVHDSVGQIGVAVEGAWASGETSTADQILRRRCDAVPRSEPSSSFELAFEWVSIGEVLGDSRDLSGVGEPSCASAPETM